MIVQAKESSGKPRSERASSWWSGAIWIGGACLLTASSPAPVAAAFCTAKTVAIPVPGTEQTQAPYENKEPREDAPAHPVRLRAALSREYDDNVDNDGPREQKGDFIALQSLALSALPRLGRETTVDLRLEVENWRYDHISRRDRLRQLYYVGLRQRWLPRLTWQGGGEWRFSDTTEKSLYDSAGLINELTYRLPGLGAVTGSWDHTHRTYRGRTPSGATNDEWGIELQGPRGPLSLSAFYRWESNQSSIARHRYERRWIGGEARWRWGRRDQVGLLYLYRPKRSGVLVKGSNRHRADRRYTLQMEYRHRLTPDLMARVWVEGDWRRSNAPGKEYRDHRVSTALVKEF